MGHRACEERRSVRERGRRWEGERERGRVGESERDREKERWKEGGRVERDEARERVEGCLLYTSPSPRD